MKVARVCLVSRLLVCCSSPVSLRDILLRLDGGSSTAVAHGACQIMLRSPRKLI